MSGWARPKEIVRLERGSNWDTSYLRALIHADTRVAWLRSRLVRVLTTALIVGFALAAPAFAQASDQPPAVRNYTMAPERIAASMAGLIALIGAIVGGRALARSRGRVGTDNGRRGAVVALVMGPVGFMIGAIVVVTADGGLGTGNGLGGGVVAMVVGLIGMTLGGLALARSRRIA